MQRPLREPLPRSDGCAPFLQWLQRRMPLQFGCRQDMSKEVRRSRIEITERSERPSGYGPGLKGGERAGGIGIHWPRFSHETRISQAFGSIMKRGTVNRARACTQKSRLGR
jgi:hypothetical protein